MPYVDAGEIREVSVPAPFERALKIVMDPTTHEDVKDFTLIFSALAPDGGCTDFHIHDLSGELMVCTQGTGRGWLAGEERELKPGVAMYAPPGVEHKTLNTGKIPLELVCIFMPPAPADYIREMVEQAG